MIILIGHFKKGVADAALLLAVASLAGLAVNSLRERPVSLEYKTRGRRLDDAVEKLIRLKAEPGALAPAFVTAEELASYRDGDERVLVFDVRPDLFFEDGHIPGAKNFTRHKFEETYRTYADAVAKAPCVIVYCAGTFCEESEKMAEALRKLGHRNIAVYRGGWEEWSAQGRRIEKQ